MRNNIKKKNKLKQTFLGGGGKIFPGIEIVCGGIFRGARGGFSLNTIGWVGGLERGSFGSGGTRRISGGALNEN